VCEEESIPPALKEFSQVQVILLPTDLGEQIPAKHLIRVVNKAIEKMGLSKLLAQYKGGGTSS
jgi:transposase